MMKTLVISVSFASAGYECLRDAYLIGSDRSSLVQTSSNSYEFSKDATFYGDPLDETIVPVLERCGIEFVILDCISSVRKF